MTTETLRSLLRLTRAGTTATIRELALLGVLVEQTEVAPTVRGLAAHLGHGRPVVTRYTDALIREGYVERRPDPADGRSVLIVATAKGRAFWREVVRV